MQVKKSLGCVIALLTCFVLSLGTFLFIELVLGRAQEPDFIIVAIDAPETVPENEPFTVQITVRNTSPEEILLHSVDISNSYLDVIHVVGISPEASNTQTIPIVGFTSYSFGQIIPIGATEKITFEFVGKENGRFAGEIDVCVEAGVLCKLMEIETVIGNGNGR